MAGRGGRAPFGTGDILPLHYPVGDSLLRVTCGTKAAFACCKDGVHSRIEGLPLRARRQLRFHRAEHVERRADRRDRVVPVLRS